MHAGFIVSLGVVIGLGPERGVDAVHLRVQRGSNFCHDVCVGCGARVEGVSLLGIHRQVEEEGGVVPRDVAFVACKARITG